MRRAEIAGVREICPSLVSILVRYDPRETDYFTLSSQIALALSGQEAESESEREMRSFGLNVIYGGSEGPDLETAAKLCSLSPKEFVAAHSNATLRVLATGFAPGFVYCGMHEKRLPVPRRHTLHREIPAGPIIFAAGQTALTGTPVPTGWHVIGRTDFRNFEPQDTPPVILEAGDSITFNPVEQFDGKA